MLTLQYIPNQQISALNTHERIQLILSVLKADKLILIDGRLSSSDEASLIRETMSSINDDFNGIEIGVMYNHEEKGFISRVKYSIASALIGDRNGITFIGPAKIISELRQHPEHIELCLQKEYLLKHSKSQTEKVSDVDELKTTKTKKLAKKN